MDRRFFLITSTVVLVTAFAAWQLRPGDRPATAELAVVTGPAPDVKTVDPVAVFQRAFWKRPTEADRILNAERREWQDEGAVSRWQWFLEVEPSPALVAYLREDNAFRLSTKKPSKIPRDAPKWFIRDFQGAHVMVARQGGMQLIFMPGNSKLYAMDSGGGFQAGEPEKEPAVLAETPADKRLPTSPPQVHR